MITCNHRIRAQQTCGRSGKARTTYGYDIAVEMLGQIKGLELLKAYMVIIRMHVDNRYSDDH